MNWTQIKENHPKAWDKFIQDQIPLCKAHTLDGELLLGDEPTVEYQVRNLYDFFDEQGIMIDITPYHHNHKLYYSHNFPTNEYYSECVGAVREYNSRLKTRKQAETQAFEKAFEILEDKLNK